MTYLLVLTSLELGGAERQALNFARYLIKNGRKVIIAGISHPGKVCEICKEENIMCVPILDGDARFTRVLYLLNKVFLLVLKRNIWVEGVSLSYTIAKFIKKEKIDISISYCSPANTILGYAKRFYKGCKYVWYQRDAGLCDEPVRYREQALHLNDFILANANSGRDWLKKNHNVKAMVIYNGVIIHPPKKKDEEWRKELQVDESKHVCTMIANLSSAKDHMSLLKAWKYMRDRGMGKNVVLVFAGRFDEQYETLLRYVKENNLSGNVRFLGQIDDISGLLSVTEIGVFGAISEGSPNGVIEQELQGLPIVATNLPEIREVVAEENYEYLFEPGNIEEIADNIMQLVTDRDTRHFIGGKNKEKALQLFSAERNFQKIIGMVENVPEKVMELS